VSALEKVFAPQSAQLVSSLASVLSPENEKLSKPQLSESASQCSPNCPAPKGVVSVCVIITAPLTMTVNTAVLPTVLTDNEAVAHSSGSIWKFVFPHPKSDQVLPVNS
jgi:hypothetical protein